MNRREAIIAAAEHLRIKFGGPADAWLDDARSLADAGLLAIDPEPDAKAGGLPIGTRKRALGGAEAILTDDNDICPWMTYRAGAVTTDIWLTHEDVADWEIIPDVPEGHVTVDLSWVPIRHLSSWSSRSSGVDPETQRLQKQCADAQIARFHRDNA